jgi:hypothetical protein
MLSLKHHIHFEIVEPIFDRFKNPILFPNPSKGSAPRRKNSTIEEDLPLAKTEEKLIAEYVTLRNRFGRGPVHLIGQSRILRMGTDALKQRVLPKSHRDRSYAVRPLK